MYCCFPQNVYYGSSSHFHAPPLSLFRAFKHQYLLAIISYRFTFTITSICSAQRVPGSLKSQQTLPYKQYPLIDCQACRFVSDFLGGCLSAGTTSCWIVLWHSTGSQHVLHKWFGQRPLQALFRFQNSINKIAGTKSAITACERFTLVALIFDRHVFAPRWPVGHTLCLYKMYDKTCLHSICHRILGFVMRIPPRSRPAWRLDPSLWPTFMAKKCFPIEDFGASKIDHRLELILTWDTSICSVMVIIFVSIATCYIIACQAKLACSSCCI